MDRTKVSRKKQGKKINISISPYFRSWFFENYKIDEDGNVEKSVVYTNYILDCLDRGVEPLKLCTFGKHLKKIVPSVYSRRLTKGMPGPLTSCYGGISEKQDQIKSTKAEILSNDDLVICYENMLELVKEFADSL